MIARFMSTPTATTADPEQRVAPSAPHWVRLGCLAIFLGLAYGAFRVGLPMASSGEPDFEYFYKAGWWVLHRGVFDPGFDVTSDGLERRGTIEWYLPAVSRFFAPLALFSPTTAGLIWLTANCVAMLAIVRLLGRYVMGLPPADWPVTQLIPFILLASAWIWEFRLNQIDTLTLLLLVAAFVHWQDGKRDVAGLWLGLATMLKLTPGLVIIWFVLKRAYRTAGVALLTIVIVGPVGDAIAFGPSAAWSANTAWLARTVDGSHRALITEQRELDWRNQASGAVLARWLHPVSYSTSWHNDPRLVWSNDPVERTLNVAHLPLPAIAALHTAAALALLAVLVWIARRPARRCSTWRLRFEWALFVLAMLWLMPVMRRYHFVFAMPAITLLAAGLHYHRGRIGWSVVAGLSLLILLGTQVLIVLTSIKPSPIEAAGAPLMATIIVGVALAWMVHLAPRLPGDVFRRTTFANDRRDASHGAAT